MKPQETSDETLMHRIQQRDHQAFQQLVDNHLVKLHSFARRLLGNSTDAEDIVQETFIRVWNNAGQWQVERAKVSTWLYNIAYHLCIDLHRRHHLVTVTLDENETALAETIDNSPEEELAEQVETALQQLPERQRSAITLCYYQDLSNQEAAQILNISVAALESLLARGRKTLRQQLQAHLAGGEII